MNNSEQKLKFGVLPITIVAIILIFIGGVVIGKLNGQPAPPRPGTEHNDNGREHAAVTEYGGEEPPTSGAHANALAWGAYEAEVPDDQSLHNLEHGGIYVSYQPDLPKDQIEKLTQLLFEPFSNKNFQPPKIVLAPRSANKSPIILSSWLRSEALTEFDQQKIENYVVRNLGKSPEPLAI